METNNGTNYRINFWLRPDTDLLKLYEAIRPFCHPPEPDEPHQPNITMIGRMENDILKDAARQPGVSGSPHYIVPTNHERRPLPYDAYVRFLETLATAYREHTDQNS